MGQRTASLSEIRKELSGLLRDLDALTHRIDAVKTALAKAIWAEFDVAPGVRVTLPLVAYFFLSHNGGEATTEEIVDFLTRIKFPSISKNLINSVGVQLKQRGDLFSYDRSRRVWSQTSG